jgi:hypothetical protein
MVDLDFAGGEAEFKKALELDPNDATAHHSYAMYVGMIGCREQDALAEANRAHVKNAEGSGKNEGHKMFLSPVKNRNWLAAPACAARRVRP